MLQKHLRALGVRAAFSPDHADFSAMRDAKAALDVPFWIGEVIHRATIEMDESGTEASAATAAVMMLGCAAEPPEPVSLTFDRPFFFAVRHRSGTPLFVGRVVEPRAEDG